MYTESTGSRKTIGDVDVFFHDGIYHLFHLVLPNHDYIAHAVSDDCFHWRRVENALHIGNPGSWDDSMLWTMHVSPHPTKPHCWRMFYTGLSRRDQGLKQRIGLAESRDLYVWTKKPVNWVDRRSALPYDLPGRPPQPSFAYDPKSVYPLNPDPLYYEASTDEARHWVSWRDPYYYHEGDRGMLLCSARVNEGPVVRRGCVALLEETDSEHFSVRPPLHHPGLYDDIEVPNLAKLDDHYYLIGSIREDAKVRYWHSDGLDSPWQTYDDNVLLASGNYAGRLCQDDHGFLLFNFFTPPGSDRNNDNLMPPPKRLHREENGQLRAHTFEKFDARVRSQFHTTRLSTLKRQRDGDRCVVENNHIRVASETAFQAFLFNDDVECFRFSTQLHMAQPGKCGLVFRINRETHDGYYLSLDVGKGVAQLRAWGTGPDGSGESMMQFTTLQQGFWRNTDPKNAHACLVVHGSYIELSIDGRVILSLADKTFLRGGLGIYVESSCVELNGTTLEQLESPIQSDEHLTVG